MNLSSAYHVARVHILSYLRSSSRETTVSTRLFRRPIFLFVVDILAFAVPLILVTLLAPHIFDVLNLTALTSQILIGLPSLIFLFFVVYGVMWEFRQISNVASSDVLNWLPIRPLEYVLGSSMALTFYISWFLAACLGVTLPLAIRSNIEMVWILFFVVCLISAFGGSFTVEILRGIINRASSVFYRRGGRSAITIRLIVTVLIIIIFLIIFNVNVMYQVLQAIVSGIAIAWFFPVVWASLAVNNALQSNFPMALVYSVSSLVFVMLLFLVGVAVKAKYWTPIQISIRVTKAEYAPKLTLLTRLGFTSTEAALLKKDLKSLTRRSEMAIFIALPIFLTLIPVITLRTSPGNEPTGYVFFNLLLGPLLFVLLLSLSSIGQEGEAVWYLYALPVRVKELVKAKASFATLPALIFLAANGFIAAIIQFTSLYVIFLFLIVGVFLTFELAFIGLAIGARHADFRVLPRARFVSGIGVLMGLGLGGVATLATLAPLIITISNIGIASHITVAGTLIIAVVICFAAYRYAVASVTKLSKQYLT